MIFKNIKQRILNIMNFVFRYGNDEIYVNDLLTDSVNDKKYRNYKKSEVMKGVDYEVYKDPIFVNGYDKNKETIVIVDDLEYTKELYNSDFKAIKRNKKLDVLNNYNLITVYGIKCGFSYMKLLNKDIKIDFAILDISINTRAKFDNGDFLELDGVDLAIETKKKFGDEVKFLFSSAHTMTREDPYLNEVMAKYDEYFGGNMEDRTIDKNTINIRYKYIYNLLMGVPICLD